MATNPSLKTLYIYNGIFVAAAGLLGPLYAVYVKEFDSSVLFVSFSWAAFIFSSILFTFIVSRIGDSVKEKEYLLLGGYLVRGIVWFLYAFSGNIIHIIVLQILLGLGEAMGTPSFDAIFARHLDRGQEVKEYSYWKLVYNISLGLATVAGGIIVNYFGFQILFFSMAGLSMISFFGILFKPRTLL